jgi:site-specific recombinase XerD
VETVIRGHAITAARVVPPERPNTAPERALAEHWQSCQRDWLLALERQSGAANTRNAYARDVRDFFAYSSLDPWRVTPVHAERWTQHLHALGLAAATINRKIAALSSLYQYAATDAVYPQFDGERAPLWPHPNPFAARSLRARVSPYGRSAYPSYDQVINLLGQIDTATVSGLRNLAILGGLFCTTRRVNEWLGLRGRDIHPTLDGAGHWFEYRCKGGAQKRQALPPAVWCAIEAYLRADQRWPIPPDDFVFRPAIDIAARLKQHSAPATSRPLSRSTVNRLIRRYGLAAGIAPERLHAHALRHAGARRREELGATDRDLQGVLGHENITTTRIYRENVLADPEDPLGSTIGEVLPKSLKLSR